MNAPRSFRSPFLAAAAALFTALLMAFGLASAPVAAAAEVASTTAEQCKEYTARTDWGGQTQSIQLDRFSVPNARLTAIRMTRTVDIYSDVTVTSENNGPTTISGTINGKVRMNAAYGLVDLEDPIAETVNETMPTGTGTFQKRYDIPVVTDTYNLTSAGDLAAWSGAGVNTFSGTSNAISNVAGSGNSDTSVRTTATMKVCVAFDYVETVTVCIGDYVWYDDDKDGVQDPGEAPVAGQTVTVRDANGKVLGSTTTDASGRWMICGLEPSTPCVGSVTLPTGYVATTRFAGTNTAVDSNIAPDATFECTTPARGSDLTFDAGIYRTTPVSSDTPGSAGAPTPKLNILRTGKRSLASTIRSGGSTTFVVTVRNTGSVNVRNITTCDTPPSLLTFTSRPTRSFYRGGQLCWNIPLLRAGKTLSFRYTMRAANVAQRQCVSNRVLASSTTTNSTSARASVCVRPTQLRELPLAG